MGAILRDGVTAEVVGEPGAGEHAADRRSAPRRRRTARVVVASLEDRHAPFEVMRHVAVELVGASAWLTPGFGTSTGDRHASTPPDQELVAGVADLTVAHWPDDVVLVVERCHHLDEASQRVLRSIVARLTGAGRGGV